MEKRILWEEQNHTNTATTPFLEKEDYTTGKTTRIHSEKSRRLKRTAALETKDPNSYIPIYSPKRLGRMGRQQGERTHYPNVKFDIKAKDSKLPVIDKVHFNGGLLFKETIDSNSR